MMYPLQRKSCLQSRKSAQKERWASLLWPNKHGKRRIQLPRSISRCAHVKVFILCLCLIVLGSTSSSPIQGITKCCKKSISIVNREGCSSTIMKIKSVTPAVDVLKTLHMYFGLLLWCCIHSAEYFRICFLWWSWKSSPWSTTCPSCFEQMQCARAYQEKLVFHSQGWASVVLNVIDVRVKDQILQEELACEKRKTAKALHRCEELNSYLQNVSFTAENSCSSSSMACYMVLLHFWESGVNLEGIELLHYNELLCKSCTIPPELNTVIASWIRHRCA